MTNDSVHEWLSPYSAVSGNVHGLNFLSSKNMLGYSATRGLHKYVDPKFEHTWLEREQGVGVGWEICSIILTDWCPN